MLINQLLINQLVVKLFSYDNTYIHIYWLVPTGLFRVNFTLLKKGKYITIIKEDNGQ